MMARTIWKHACSAAMLTLFLNAAPALAQALPGPAASGWFVVIGQPTTTLQEMKSMEFPPQMKDFYDNLCVAYLLGGNDANSAMNDGTRLRYIVAVTPRQKFGPFPTPDHAAASLRQAGWGRNEHWNVWVMEQKCP